jgi:iron(III) transport system substrate-binding protein
MYQRRFRVLGLGCLSSLLLVACGGADDAPSTSAPAAGGDDWQQVVEAAEDEGAVSYYSSDVPEVNDAVVERFNELYPDIQVEVLRLATSDLATRIQQEQSAGISRADVLQISSVQLVNQHPEWFLPIDEDLLPALGENSFPEGARGERWVAFGVTLPTIVYNTDEITDPPETWQDVADPRYRGEVLLTDVRVSSAWTGWASAMREAHGDEYLEALAALDLGLAPSAVPAGQEIAAGAYSISLPNVDAGAAPLAAAGAPVASRVMQDPVVGYTGVGSVFAEAPNPNAARVFANFLLTPDAFSARCVAAGATAGTVAPISGPVEECEERPEEVTFLRLDLDPSDAETQELFDLLGLEATS